MTQSRSRPGTRPTSGSRSGVTPKIPAQRWVISGELPVSSRTKASRLRWISGVVASSAVCSFVERLVPRPAQHESALGGLMPVPRRRPGRPTGLPVRLGVPLRANELVMLSTMGRRRGAGERPRRLCRRGRPTYGPGCASSGLTPRIAFYSGGLTPLKRPSASATAPASSSSASAVARAAASSPVARPSSSAPPG